MWRTGLITILLCVVKCQASNVATQRTILQNVPMSALLMNDTNIRQSLLEQEEYSGNDNDNDSSGSGQGLSSQIQTPDLYDFPELEDGYQAVNSSKRLVTATGKEGGGQVMDGEEQPQAKADDWDFMSGSGNQSEDSTDSLAGRVADTPPPVTHKHLLGGGKLHLEVTCEERSCQGKQHHLKLVSTGGNTIVSSAEMALYCTVHSPLNETLELTWYYPIWQNLSRMYLTESEERTKKEKVTVSVLRLRNVSEEDSGLYRCQAVFDPNHGCCNLNATVNVQVYTPPSIATDVAIVLTVCFLELVVIIYFKTRSDNKKQCKPTKGADHRSSYKQLQLVQNKT